MELAQQVGQLAGLLAGEAAPALLPAGSKRRQNSGPSSAVGSDFPSEKQLENTVFLLP